jgi:CubicO group peptidase (beta-lactamase class C family)
MRADTLHRIYSMSKPITAVALMMLYEEGRFLLGDPVADYLPELADLQLVDDPDADPPVASRRAPRQPTIRDLLRHSAGFSYGIFGDTAVDRRYRDVRLLEEPTLAGFTRVLGSLPLRYEPGTRWHYSVAVDVQGRLVEVLSGLSFGEFLRRRIFDPLGMQDTFFVVPAERRERLAQLYIPEDGRAGWNMLWTFGSSPRLRVADPALSRGCLEGELFESGGAGLVSSAGDYLRFALMLLNGGELDGVRLLSPLTVAHMARNHIAGLGADGLSTADAFGLGFGISLDTGVTGELASDGSYGWGGAAGTLFWVDPAEQVVGVFMTQTIASRDWLADKFRVLTYQALLDSARD